MPITVAKPNNLKKIRTGEGLTVAALAKLSDVSVKSIETTENRTRNLTPPTKHKIVKGLNAHETKSKIYTYKAVFPDDPEY